MARDMCPKCKGSGFLPFKNKEGKLIPHTFLNCECHEDEPERYVPYSPDLIDFPVSWDFYRHYQQYYGQLDPGSNTPPEEPPKPIIEVQGGVPWVVHDQLKAHVLFLQGKINDLSKKKKEQYTIK